MSNELVVGSSAQDQITAALQAGKALSLSPLLPMTLRGEVENGRIAKPFESEVIEANVTLVALQAMAWNMPFTFVASEAYVIGGKLAYQGKLIAAVANSSGILSRRLYPEYDGEGDDRRVTIYGTIREENSPRSVQASYRVDGFQEYTDKRTGKKERRKRQGWFGDVDQKLWYTGVVKWVRRHAPELLGGVTTEIDLDEESARTIDGYISPQSGRNEAAPKANEPNSSVESNERASNAPPLTLPELIGEWKGVIAEAETQEQVERVGNQIKLDENLPAPAKDDLVKIAKSRWTELQTAGMTEQEVAQ